jgi:hypothetical protein
VIIDGTSNRDLFLDIVEEALSPLQIEVGGYDRLSRTGVLVDGLDTQAGFADLLDDHGGLAVP